MCNVLFADFYFQMHDHACPVGKFVLLFSSQAGFALKLHVQLENFVSFISQHIYLDSGVTYGNPKFLHGW